MNATWPSRISVLLLILLPVAFAHDMSVDHMSVNLTDQSVFIDYVPKANSTAENFMEEVSIMNGNMTCPAAYLGMENVTYKYRYDCGEMHFLNITIESDDPQYTNIGMFTLAGQSTEFVFSGERSGFIIPVDQLYHSWGIERNTSTVIMIPDATSTVPEAFTEPWYAKGWLFLKLGVEHILIGYDHILFLIGLIIIVASARELLMIVTSFTVAHSITLILASLGIITLSSRITESVIALSIVFIALENIHFLMRKREGKRPKGWFANPRYRWTIVFAFGLIHGLGFSSVLRDIGLPERGLIASLLSFNIGVEIGQLLIIAVLLPIIYYMRKRKLHISMAAAVSLVIGILGAVWFIQRAFGF